MKPFRVAECPFQCDLPYDFHDTISHSPTPDAGFLVTAAHKSFELGIWLSNIEGSGFDPCANAYLLNLAQGQRPEDIVFSGPLRPGSRIVFPYHNPIVLSGGAVAYHFAVESTTPHGVTISALYCRADLGAKCAFFRFTALEPIEQCKDAWLAVIRSFELKSNSQRPPTVSGGPISAHIVSSRRKATVEFVPVSSPIYEPVTKFGGQPTWLREPQWPLSATTGEQMEFICQIALSDAIFPGMQGKLAYLFISRQDTVCRSDSEGGESAVIIQPDGSAVRTCNLATGPTLRALEWSRSHAPGQPIPCELAVRLTERAETVPVVREGRLFAEAIEEIKIGGVPVLREEIALSKLSAGRWRLLLQLDSTAVPFLLNFGGGVGYAFLSEPGDRGCLLVVG